MIGNYNSIYIILELFRILSAGLWIYLFDTHLQQVEKIGYVATYNKNV